MKLCTNVHIAQTVKIFPGQSMTFWHQAWVVDEGAHGLDVCTPSYDRLSNAQSDRIWSNIESIYIDYRLLGPREMALFRNIWHKHLVVDLNKIGVIQYTVPHVLHGVQI
jgi:hypothetical protein